METIVDFDVLDAIENFGIDGFPKETPFDYIDSLVRDGDKYGVVIFVEPAGNVTHFECSWIDALRWWEKVFASQPDGIDYATAGWYLYFLSGDCVISGSPEDVWKTIGE